MRDKGISHGGSDGEHDQQEPKQPGSKDNVQSSSFARSHNVSLETVCEQHGHKERKTLAHKREGRVQKGLRGERGERVHG